MTTQIIIFSKNRPMQLKALIESISFYSLENLKIKILYKESEKIQYSNLIKLYTNFSWIKEKDFQSDVHSILKSSETYTLFLVDDVIFTRKFSIVKIEKYFSTSDNIHGCQLRLGRNIEAGNNLIDDLPFLKWSIFDSKSHWGYPFDLSSGMYKTSKVEKIYSIILSKKVNIKSPNFFEHYFYEYYKKNNNLLKNKFYFSPFFSVCLILTINRVQNEFINRFDRSSDFSPETLNRLALKKFSINWQKYSNIINTYPHWDGSKLEFVANKSIKEINLTLQNKLELNYLNPYDYYQKNKFRFQLIIEYNRFMRKIKYGVEIYLPFLNFIYRKIKKEIRGGLF